MNTFNKILTIACVVFVTVPGCTSEEEPTGFLYSNVELEMAPESGALVRYLEGEPFTGEQIYRFSKNDSIYIINSFQDGFLTGSVAFKKDGSVRAKYEYKFNNGNHVGLTEYYSDGSKKSDWLQGGASEDGLGFTKEWHPNGQLKFEMQWDENNQYHGLMTKWDDKGNIIAREKYEHGQLVKM